MNNQNNTLNVGDAFDLLKSNGFPRSFVEKLLPEWWDNSLLKTSSGVLQFALIIKQRLGLEVYFSNEGLLSIKEDPFTVRFKHRKDTCSNDLGAVKNLGKAAASISRHITSDYTPLPNEPLLLRKYILSHTGQNEINLDGLLSICWSHGIPVLFLENLPAKAKRMTGMIVNHNERPSILLGFRHKHKARQLFVLAHELAHLSLGHVASETLLIDEDLDSETDSLNNQIEITLDEEEKDADNFALRLIRGEYAFSFSELKLDQPTELAIYAMEKGALHGIDPGHIIVSYAFETLDWPTANNAMKFFEGSDGAIRCIKESFLRNSNLEEISDEVKSYLFMLQGV